MSSPQLFPPMKEILPIKDSFLRIVSIIEMFWANGGIIHSDENQFNQIDFL